MAIRRLVNMLDAIAEANQKARANANARQPSLGSDLVFTGLVLAVSDIALSVSVRGSVVLAGQDTDEPLRAGQLVWMSRGANGDYVVHGSAH